MTEKKNLFVVVCKFICIKKTTDMVTLVVAMADAKNIVEALCGHDISWQVFMDREREVFKQEPIAEMPSKSFAQKS